MANLVRKYRGLIRCKARSYYLVGADRDDIIQEGMIGLYKAIRDYDPTRQASFHSFAELCVTRQIITAVKSATRRKHSPLNGYVSLSRSTSMEEDGERLLSDILAAKGVCDPAEIVVAAWETDFIRTGVAEALSPFEARVLTLYTQRSLVPGDRRHARDGTPRRSTTRCSGSSARWRRRSAAAAPARGDDRAARASTLPDTATAVRYTSARSLA